MGASPARFQERSQVQSTMSIRWIEAAMQHSKAHGNNRLVLIILANNADDETGSCYPGIPYIAKRAGIDERTVQRCVRNLQELGEISVTIQGSHFDTNLYKLNESLLSPVADCHPPGGRLSPKPSVEPSEIKQTTRKPKKPTEIAEDWEPSEKGRQFAMDRDIGIDAEIDKFIDHHRKIGNKYMDWDAAWRTWCRNSAQWAAEKQATGAEKTKPTAFYDSKGWAYPRPEEYSDEYLADHPDPFANE